MTETPKLSFSTVPEYKPVLVNLHCTGTAEKPCNHLLFKGEIIDFRNLSFKCKCGKVTTVD